MEGWICRWMQMVMRDQTAVPGCRNSCWNRNAPSSLRILIPIEHCTYDTVRPCYPSTKLCTVRRQCQAEKHLRYICSADRNQTDNGGLNMKMDANGYARLNRCTPAVGCLVRTEMLPHPSVSWILVSRACTVLYFHVTFREMEYIGNAKPSNEKGPQDIK